MLTTPQSPPDQDELEAWDDEEGTSPGSKETATIVKNAPGDDESKGQQGHEGRMFQCYLLLGTRVVVQGIRLSWVPLLVYIAEDLKMGTIEQGAVLSAFSLGYLMTQVVGGVAADRYGGKPVQSLTLAVMTVNMILAPEIARLFGWQGLWLAYFLMGFFAGPQHPAYNAMAAAWFPQDELGTPRLALNPTISSLNRHKPDTSPYP